MKTFLLRIKLTLALFLTLSVANSLYAATFIVTRTADDALAGSLRWAITQANALAGNDIITFNIAEVAPNVFEGTAPNRYAVLTLSSALPVLTQGVFIDGTTQANTNTGILAGRTVGVDAHLQPDIQYPDVYIVCGYTLPTNEN